MSSMTGAGDVVISSVVGLIGSGFTLEEACQRSAYFASEALKRVGNYVIPKQLFTQSVSRSSDKRVVFTNGCFDLLHDGHLELLKKCRDLGDWVIVGLNSDESVKRLKGKTRPFRSETSRKRMLESLRSVDEVIIFNEDTPYELIQSILPDVLVKGGDYALDQVIGGDLVVQNGGTVEIFPTVAGHSTTTLALSIGSTYHE